MSARILDGKAIADQIRQEIAIAVDVFVQASACHPCLVAVLVGDDQRVKSMFATKSERVLRLGSRARYFVSQPRHRRGSS